MFGLFKQDKKGSTGRSQRGTPSRPRRAAPPARPHPQSIQKRNPHVASKPRTFKCFFDNCKATFDTERGLQLHIESHLANADPSSDHEEKVKPQTEKSCNMFAGLSFSQTQQKDSPSAPPVSSFGFIKPVAKPASPVVQQAPPNDLFSGLCFSQPSSAPSPQVVTEPPSESAPTQSAFGFITEVPPTEDTPVEEVAPAGASAFSFLQTPTSATKPLEEDAQPKSTRTDVFSELMLNSVSPTAQTEPILMSNEDVVPEEEKKDIQPVATGKNFTCTQPQTLEDSPQNLVTKEEAILSSIQTSHQESLNSSPVIQKAHGENLNFSSEVRRLTADVQQSIENYWGSLNSPLEAENASREKEKTLVQSIKDEIQTRDKSKIAQEAAIRVEDYEEAERMNSVISLCERNIQRCEEALVRLKRDRITSLSTSLQRNETVSTRAREGVSNIRSLQDQHDCVMQKFVTETAKELGESERAITAKMDRVQRILTISTEDLDKIEREEKEIESQILDDTKDTNEKKKVLVDSRSALEAEIEELFRQVRVKKAEADKLTLSIADLDEEVNKVRLRYESQLKAVDDRKQRVLAERQEHNKDKVTLDVTLEDLNLRKSQADEHESKLKDELSTVAETCDNLQDAIARLELKRNRIAGREKLQKGDNKACELSLEVSRLKKTIAEVETNFEEKKGKQAEVEEAKASIVAQIPVLETQKKAAVMRRAFKDAGRINNDIKALSAKLQSFKDVQENLEHAITSQQSELTSLRIQLENTKEEFKNITSSADLEIYNVLRKFKWEIQEVLQDYDKIPETERRVHESELNTYIFEITEICTRYDWDPEANKEQNVPDKGETEEKLETQSLKEVANTPEQKVPLLSKELELSPDEVKARLIDLNNKLVISSEEIDIAVAEERYEDAEAHQTVVEETEAAINALQANIKLESEDRGEGGEANVVKEVIIDEEGIANDTMTAPCSTITSEPPNQSHLDFKSNQSQIESKSDEVEGQPSVGSNEPRAESKSSGAPSRECKSLASTATSNPSACQGDGNTSKAKTPPLLINAEQESSKPNNLEQEASCADEPVEGLFEGLNV